MNPSSSRRLTVLLSLPTVLSLVLVLVPFLVLSLVPGCSEECTKPRPATQPPVTGFTAQSGNNGVDLSWTNPANADFRGVLIRYSPDALPATAFDGLPALDASGHSSFEGEPGGMDSLSHAHREVGTRYYYSAFAYSAGNLISTAVCDSAVATDRVAPPPLVAFWTEVTVDGLRLHWTSPTDADYDGALLRYSTTGFPSGPEAGAPVFSQNGGVVPGAPGASVVVDHEGLTLGMTYYYSAFACDASRNYAAALQESATYAPFLPCTSAQNLLENLLTAYLTRQAVPYESLLARDFEFYFSEEDQHIAEKYDRDAEVEVHHNMFGSVEDQDITLSFTLSELTEDPSRPDPLHPEDSLWTILMTNVDLRLTRIEGGSIKTYKLEDGVEQFWFREEAWGASAGGPRIWTIVTWRELTDHTPGDTMPAENVSWGVIKDLYRGSF